MMAIVMLTNASITSHHYHFFWCWEQLRFAKLFQLGLASTLDTNIHSLILHSEKITSLLSPSTYILVRETDEKPFFLITIYLLSLSRLSLKCGHSSTLYTWCFFCVCIAAEFLTLRPGFSTENSVSPFLSASSDACVMSPYTYLYFCFPSL